MYSTDKQVNRSPGLPALEKLYLAPWGLYDLAVFGVPLVIVIAALQFAGRPWCFLSIVPLVLLVWLLSFFRNPPRKIPDDILAIVAPADGLVTDVTALEQND